MTASSPRVEFGNLSRKSMAPGLPSVYPPLLACGFVGIHFCGTESICHTRIIFSAASMLWDSLCWRVVNFNQDLGDAPRNPKRHWPAGAY